MPTTQLHSPSNPLQDPTSTLLKLWPGLSVKHLQVAGVQSVARLLPTARSRCGIYVLSFSNGEYYVGRTVNFMNRFQAHRRNHDDITEVFFYPKAKRDLVRDEYAATHAMEVAGFLLRGAGVDVGGNLQGSSVFDEIVELRDQQEWLTSLPSDDIGAEARLDLPDQRRRNRFNLDRLMKDPRFEDLVPALRRYVAWTVPFPRRTEVSRWAISAVPAVNVSTWPRLMTLTIQSLETLYVCAPVNEQTRTVITINVDMATMLARWGTLTEFRKHFGAARAQQVVYRVRPGLLALEAEGAQDLMGLLDAPGVTAAARQLNLHMMRKGACIQRRAHSFGLADKILEPLGHDDADAGPRRW